jgi:hypothetical protein
MSNWGFVYCLFNESIPGLYKIGYTSKSPISRAEELSRATGVPTAFEVYFYIETKNPAQMERLIHDRLSQYRENGSREFFALDDREIYAVFQWADDQQGIVARSWQYEAMCAVREFELSHPPESRNGRGMEAFYARA